MVIQEVKELHLELSDCLFKCIANTEIFIVTLTNEQMRGLKEQNKVESIQQDDRRPIHDRPSTLQNSDEALWQPPTPQNQMRIDTDDFEVTASPSSSVVQIYG